MNVISSLSENVISNGQRLDNSIALQVPCLCLSRECFRYRQNDRTGDFGSAISKHDMKLGADTTSTVGCRRDERVKVNVKE